MAEPRTIYVLGTDWTAAGASRDQAEYLDGCVHWRVFNAPRPLPGDHHWTGDFRHGSFYVALQMDDTGGNPWLKECLDLDGWPVELVTAEQIETKLRAKAEALVAEYANDAWMTHEQIRAEVLGEYRRHYLEQLGLPYVPAPEAK